MSEADFAVESMREVADRRIRPARAANAVTADRTGSPIPSGPVRRLTGYDHAAGQAIQYGVYGRGQYGRHRYA